EKLSAMRDSVGRERLVLDLSCRLRDDGFYVVTDRWQTFTQEKVDAQLLELLAADCAEFLVHGVDVEGKSQGVQEDLIAILGEHSPLPVTYAGGVHNLSDLALVKELGKDRVDLTIGSALDIFGGDIPYSNVLEWMKKHS
ncbi:MAG: HisA/HisF-related TIM barrel protein, partial [Pseudomonadales bacterium]